MKLFVSFLDATVRRKLMYIACLSVVVAMFLGLLLSSVLQWLVLREELATKIYAKTSTVAVKTAPALLVNDADAAKQVLGALTEFETVEFIGLFDKTGNRLARYMRPGVATPPYQLGLKEGESSIFNLRHLDIAVPVLSNGKRIGLVQVRSNLVPLYGELNWNMLVTFIATLGALSAAMLMLWRLLPGITNPIQHLVLLMDKVSRGNNYALRSDLTGEDEVGKLAQGFNDMLEQIEARDVRLKRQRENLEKEVALRTDDLKNVNEVLEKELIERKQLEKDLLESQGRFLALTETTNDWIWQTDQQGRYVYASSKVRDILGFDAAEVCGKTPFDFMSADEAERLAGVFKEIIDARKAFSFLENISLHKNGSQVVLETSGVPIWGDDGSFHGYFGIDRDITERTRIAEQLRETRDYLENLFNSASAPIIVWNPSFRITMFNHAAERLTGRKAEEFIGKPLDVLFPDNKRKQALDIIFRTAKTGERWDAVEMAIRHVSGTVRTVLWNSATVYSADGQHLLATLAQGQDISERKQAEEQIRQLNEDLDAKVKQRTQQLLEAQEELVRKEKLAVLGQVAGSVGHELRNPLGVINNAVYYLQTVLAGADDNVREYLNIIKNEVAGSERIVSDLLDSVRTKPPRPEITEVRQLLELTLDKVTIPAGITVKLDIPASLPPLWVDPQQIHQVLRNLISNGIEAMGQEGSLELSAKADMAAREITISVRDNGSGIAPETRAKLFQPLFTTKARGIGLGLVVVRNLTLANGGNVHVDTEEGKGSEFAVSLPAAGEIIASGQNPGNVAESLIYDVPGSR